VGYVPPSKSCRWRGKRLHHGGGVCELCVSGSKKPSEREFFVPAGTDLAVKLLKTIGEGKNVGSIFLILYLSN
jgi:hypothetical protein